MGVPGVRLTRRRITCGIGLTTAGRGIQYEPRYRSDQFTGNWPNDWRIMEQWLPHSTWFLFATAIGG